MLPLYFSSIISQKHHESLENLMFFNPLQKNRAEEITNILNEYGYPSIIEENGVLKVQIGALEGCQTLAAFDGEGEDASLLAVLAFYRKSVEEVVAIYVAVIPECSSAGIHANEKVAQRLLSHLQDDMKKLRGVKKISIGYFGDTEKINEIQIKA